MNNILFVGLEYEDFLKSPASLRYREYLSRINDFNFNNICRDIDMFRMFGIKSLAEIASIYRNKSKIDNINKLFFRELISEQIGFANCFLNDNELKKYYYEPCNGIYGYKRIHSVAEVKRNNHTDYDKHLIE